MIGTVRRAFALVAMLTPAVPERFFRAAILRAQDMGFFAKRRLNVEIVPISNAVTKQMLQPSIDVSAKYGLIHSAFPAAELFTK